ncbi:hypothetical protein [Cellulomonas fimi]|uniref:Uncharacterized protein n=1 Tax=Cellulomonas fimi (strain ATCC 484 / DSM 20113 / JCM 1341 / CCUG 24087 / LMG 16345 / NBRC 15513 / NCIMB 8980 / NCTC 7547 / NRS-133) TaxID=590998 RepID=F4H095_CELFA|nr:hypothetical protein [Cellulomonas fimi]AEE46142.1 hypothetical protein Celf_2012 [Cellulomonas fimi ATCC 484]NNH07071.1 hypothetical protein [Cellulomonas fimi]VEH31801.1 Uncharacterised protein [Cellulomonas fimi]
MRRLVWVGVGVVVTVVVLRQGRRLVDAYVPAGATEVVDGVTRARRAWDTARREFAAGLAEREEQLRHDLVGDVDVERLRSERPQRVDALRQAWSSRGTSARGAAPKGWADGPTDDPDDDDGYAFF